MVTPAEARERGFSEGNFSYNSTSCMDISFDEKQISIDKIKADGYEIGVNHRPIRTGHVNRIKATFVGDTISIKVVFDSRDECYHIIQGQHVFTASTQIIRDNGDILCGIIKNKSTGAYLDACKTEDRRICRQYSYRVTEGQERNCIADRISMVTELSDKYKEESGHTKGVIEYVRDNQYGYQKLSESTIKLYLSYGNALQKHNLLVYAQKERWDEKLIKARLAEYKLKKQDYESITLRLYPEVARLLKENGLADNSFWNNAGNCKHKINKQKILESFEAEYDQE